MRRPKIQHNSEIRVGDVYWQEGYRCEVIVDDDKEIYTSSVSPGKAKELAESAARLYRGIRDELKQVRHR